jgi:hypothetical protein
MGEVETRKPSKRGWLPWVRCGFLVNYLRRDATAQGLILLSMIDITSSFLKDGDLICLPPVRAMPKVWHTSIRMSIGGKRFLLNCNP